jgi:hypothetical protein
MKDIVLVHRDLLREFYLPLWIKTILFKDQVPEDAKITFNVVPGRGGKTIYSIQREGCKNANTTGQLDHPDYVIWLRVA